MKVKKKNVVGVLAITFAMLAILAYPLYLYVSNDEIRPAGIEAYIEFSEILRPVGDVTAEWEPSSGSNYECVDETTAGGDGATTYVEGDSTDRDTYELSDMSEEERGEYTQIDSITIWMIAQRSGTGVNEMELGIVYDSVDYVGTTTATGSTWANYTHTWTTNPATSAEWTISEVNNVSAYIEAIDGTPSHQVTQIGLIVPGRQVVWGPTFTSSPDTSIVATDDYSYTATCNETSDITLYEYDGPTGGSGLTDTAYLTTVSDFASGNVVPSPNNGLYYDKLDETTSGGDGTLSYFLTLSSSSQASVFMELTDINWASYGTITDIDVGAWLIHGTSSVGGETDCGGGIQITPGDSGTNNDIYRGAVSWGAWVNHSVQWEVNPETSSEWTTSVVDGMRAYCADWSTSAYATWTQFRVIVNITYTLSEPEAWFTFSQSNDTLWGTPDYLDDVGDWDVSLRANSSAGEGSAWQNFTITVAEPWAPYFTSTASATAVVDYEYNYSYTANESSSFWVDVTDPAAAAVDDLWAYYKYKDTSVTEAYVSGNNVWDFDRIIFLAVDLSDMDSEATLDELTINIYRTYSTATGPISINVSGAFGSVNGSYNGVWDEAMLKSLTPSGSYVDSGTCTAGWNSWTVDATDWQTQYDTNQTIYIALTGWLFGSTTQSYGFNVSTVMIDVTTTGTGGSGWLKWTGEDFIWGTPTDTDVGLSWDVSINATSDTGLLSAYQNFTVTVGEGWEPTFTSSPDLTGSVEILYEYVATCNETVTWPADDTFAYCNATWLHWGQSNHTVYGTPESDDFGWYYVNISATSTPGYLTGYQNWTLTIGVPDPTVTTSPDVDIEVGESYYYDADADITIVEWTLSTNATFLSIDDETGEVTSGVIGLDDVGALYYVNFSCESVYATFGYQNYSLNVTFTDETDPVANAGPDQSVDTNETVYFSGALSTDNSGTIDNYTWSFTYDGGTEYLYGVNPTFVFEYTGSYVVTLRCTDEAENWDEDTMTVTVSEPSPSFAQRVYGNMGDYALIALCAIGLLGMMVTPAFYMKYGQEEKGKSFIYAIFWFVLFFGLFYAGVYAFL